MDKMAGASSHHQPQDTHYLCNKCRKTFHLGGMYACYHGHYLCKSCYQKINTASNYKIDAISLETSDNLGDESSFLTQPVFLAYDKEPDCFERKRMMFPNPSAYQQNTIDKHSSLISLATIYKPSLLNMTGCSKKPIVCPQYDCRKTIAISSLDAHFHHEHKQVATIVTQLETRNCLEFNFRDLRGTACNMCLVLINLEASGDDSSLPSGGLPSSQRLSYSKASRSSQSPLRPFFILVAAKMPCGIAEDASEACDAFEGQYYRPHERVFFYVTSNIVGNYSYTIAASTPIQNVRLKYFGPLLSVNEDFRKLCEDGKGLVLNHYHINGMSNGCCCPVNLDLILHEREDQLLSTCEFNQ